MYQEQQQFAIPQRQVPKAVKAIILSCVTIFILEMLTTDTVYTFINRVFGLSLQNILRLYLWELVTYMFLHGGLWHILINMMVLYFFGCEMENILGTKRFVKLYLGCGILAGVGWMLVGVITGNHGLCIGASGAVYGIMGAFAAMFPNRVITLLLFFVLPVTMTARTMVIGIGLMSLVLMFKADGNIAHSAHLAGGLAGYLYGLWLLKNPGILDGDVFSETASRAGPMSEIKAQLRRRTMHLVDVDETPDPEEINKILEKISADGIGSLSRKEREVLERASEKGSFS